MLNACLRMVDATTWERGALFGIGHATWTTDLSLGTLADAMTFSLPNKGLGSINRKSQ
jgi:hypothetical protein